MNEQFFIVDTCVLMGGLKIIESLMTDELPFRVNICIPYVVLQELDKNKNKIDARAAIRFLEQNKSTENLHIFTESTIPTDDKTFENNDDRIVFIAQYIQGSILITQDIVMELKAWHKGIRVVLSLSKTYNDIRLQILRLLGYDAMETFESDELTRNYLLDKARDLLMPVIFYRFQIRLGRSFMFFLPKDAHLLDFYGLIDLVNKKFSLFDDFVPRGSAGFIKKAIKKTKGEDMNDVKKQLGMMLALFRIFDEELR